MPQSIIWKLRFVCLQNPSSLQLPDLPNEWRLELILLISSRYPFVWQLLILPGLQTSPGLGVWFLWQRMELSSKVWFFFGLAPPLPWFFLLVTSHSTRVNTLSFTPSCHGILKAPEIPLTWIALGPSRWFWSCSNQRSSAKAIRFLIPIISFLGNNMRLWGHSDPDPDLDHWYRHIRPSHNHPGKTNISGNNWKVSIFFLFLTQLFCHTGYQEANFNCA